MILPKFYFKKHVDKLEKGNVYKPVLK